MRTPSEDIFLRLYNGFPSMGPKLLSIRRGRDPIELKNW